MPIAKYLLNWSDQEISFFYSAAGVVVSVEGSYCNYTSLIFL